MLDHSCTLRAAALEDTDTIIALQRAAYAEYDGKLDPPSGVTHEDENDIRRKLAQGHYTLACAREASIGCVFYQAHPDHIYLGRLAVPPAYRRQGVGRVLVAHVEAQALQLGLARVRLGVRLALPLNRSYYERQGYSVVAHGTHPGYSEPTFVWMEKQL